MPTLVFFMVLFMSLIVRRNKSTSYIVKNIFLVNFLKFYLFFIFRGHIGFIHRRIDTIIETIIQFGILALVVVVLFFVDFVVIRVGAVIYTGEDRTRTVAVRFCLGDNIFGNLPEVLVFFKKLVHAGLMRNEIKN